MAKSVAQKKKEKAAYDREYRAKNRALLKAKKAAYFQRTYDPVKAAEERKKKMPQHIEYCRRPEYKAKKKLYDHNRMRGRYDGEWLEVALLLYELQKEIRRQEPDRENRYRQSQRHGWSPITHAKRREKRANERIITLESICC